MDRVATPQNERSRRTRGSILDATWQLLEEDGPEQVTMAAVARRAGLTRRGLYLHFASRAELLLALNDHVNDRLELTESIRPVFEAPDAVTALEEFVAHLVRFHPSIRRIDTAILLAARADPDAAQLVERGTLAWHDGCQLIARRLADEGRLAEPWTVETAADLLWHFMFPDVLERLTVERGWPLEQYGALLTVVLRRALVVDPT